MEIFCAVKNAINKAILSLFGSMNLKLFAVLSVVATLSACVKAPSYPIIPAIEFKSVSSSLIKSGYSDTITFTFTDGDGDIGVTPSAADSCDQCSLKNGDSTCLHLNGFNVFLIDSRDNCVGIFASPDVDFNGQYNAISGEVLVITAIDSKQCFTVPDPNCKLDTVVYTILLRDKAGHFSNTINTVPIYVDGK